MKIKLLNSFIILTYIFLVIYGCGKKEQEVKPLPVDSTQLHKQEATDTAKNEMPPEPMVFTKAQVKQLLQSKNSPVFRGLRKALNMYVKGIKSDCVDDFALYPDTSRKEVWGLNSFEKEYFKSKFYVISVEDNVMGGVTMDVMFDYKFDKIFSIWMYKILKCYSLRAIYAIDMPPEDFRNMKILYKNFLEDKRFAN